MSLFTISFDSSSTEYDSTTSSDDESNECAHLNDPKTEEKYHFQSSQQKQIHSVPHIVRAPPNKIGNGMRRPIPKRFSGNNSISPANRLRSNSTAPISLSNKPTNNLHMLNNSNTNFNIHKNNNHLNCHENNSNGEQHVDERDNSENVNEILANNNEDNNQNSNDETEKKSIIPNVNVFSDNNKEYEENVGNAIVDDRISDDGVKVVPKSASTGLGEDIKEKESVFFPKQIYILFPPTKYIINRIVKTAMRCKKYVMQSCNGHKVLFNSKVKSSKMIRIIEGGDFHSCSTAATMICDVQSKSFSLRKNDRFGDEILTFRGKNISNNNSSNFGNNESNNVVLYYFMKDGKIPPKLTSPSIYNFGNRKVVANSTKNCILQDMEGNEYIAVMKTEKNTITIEAQPDFLPVCMFAIGIASFLFSGKK